MKRPTTPLARQCGTGAKRRRKKRVIHDRAIHSIANKILLRGARVIADFGAWPCITAARFCMVDQARIAARP
jgi:hypothetical protein